jgi:DNA-directed RNA polymerase specialized sigma24 family protein
MSQEFFANAYQQGYRATVRFLLCKGAFPDEAEEMAQAAWTRGWEARTQLKSEDRILPWVNSIAYHALCTERRRRSRHGELKEMPDKRPGPASCLAEIDVNRLMTLCSPLDRSLLLERFCAGHNMEDIARKHCLSRVATRVRIHRSKVSLRRHTQEKAAALRRQMVAARAWQEAA